jgi:hypothetical protein
MLRLITLGAFTLFLLVPESLARAQTMTREQFFSRYGEHLEEGTNGTKGTEGTLIPQGVQGTTKVEHGAAAEEAALEDEDGGSEGIEESEGNAGDGGVIADRPLTPEERREARIARGRPETGSLPPSADTALRRSGELAGTGPPLAAVGITSLLSALGIRRWRRSRRVVVNPELL